MATKKTSDTISQQRKARQEFLELKKMQSGDIAPPPKPSEEAVLPKTLKEKLQNYWFHFKWHTIGVILSVAVLAVLISQCAAKTDYDMKIIYFSYTPVLDQQLAPVGDYFEGLSKDINGDGEVNISVVNCSMSTKQDNAQYANSVYIKLQALIAADSEAVLYITDSESVEYFEAAALNDFFQGEQLPLNEKFYTATKTEDFGDLPEGLQIATRRIDGTIMENQGKIDSVRKEALSILEKLKQN